MKKTNLTKLCGTRNGYPVYRRIFQEDGKYYIKYDGEIVDVTKFVESNDWTVQRNNSVGYYK